MANINGNYLLKLIKTEYLNVSDEELQFITDEYLKQLNLANPNQFKEGWYFDNGNYISSSNDTCIIDYLEVEGGKTYTLSFDISNENIILWYDSSKTLISRQRVTAISNTVTLPSNAKYVRYAFKNIVSQVMLNEGETALDYQPYNGAIVHQKDVEPVLLWENASPNNALSARQIDIVNSSAYKYLIIGYKYFANSFNGIHYLKIDNIPSTTYFLSALNLTNELASRQIDIPSDYNHINIAAGYKMNVGATYTAPEENNTFLVPIKIYGTNIL